MSVSLRGNSSFTYPIGCARQYALREHNNMIRACEVDIEQEADEVAVVEVADTVVHPRTVVV